VAGLYDPAGVTKKWNHRGDARGAGPACCINHDEQLHQILIRRRAGRLNNKDIATADVLIDLYEGLAIGEGSNSCIPKSAPIEAQIRWASCR
jgi:hypothetical protein